MREVVKSQDKYYTSRPLNPLDLVPHLRPSSPHSPNRHHLNKILKDKVPLHRDTLAAGKSCPQLSTLQPLTPEESPSNPLPHQYTTPHRTQPNPPLAKPNLSQTNKQTQTQKPKQSYNQFFHSFIYSFIYAYIHRTIVPSHPPSNFSHSQTINSPLQAYHPSIHPYIQNKTEQASEQRRREKKNKNKKKKTKIKSIRTGPMTKLYRGTNRQDKQCEEM